MYCNKRLCVSWSVRVIPPESISPHSPSYPRCCCMWRANLQLCSGLFGQWSLLRKCSRLVLKPQLQSLISVLKCSWSWWGIPDQTQRLPSPGKESLKERDILRDQHVLKIRWSWVPPAVGQGLGVSWLVCSKSQPSPSSRRQQSQDRATRECSRWVHV